MDDNGVFEESGIPVSDIVARYGNWVVTPMGLECLSPYYCVDKEDFSQESDVLRLMNIMSEKRWVSIMDFFPALTEAREHHYPNG